MLADATITVPRLVGARSTAQRLAQSALHGDEFGTVTVDMTRTEAAAQSFADEIVQQVWLLRDCEQVVLLNPTPRQEALVLDAMGRRGGAAHLSVVHRD